MLAAQLLSAVIAHDDHVETAPLPAEQEGRADLLGRAFTLLIASSPGAAAQAWDTGRTWTLHEALAEVRRALQVNLVLGGPGPDLARHAGDHRSGGP